MLGTVPPTVVTPGLFVAVAVFAAAEMIQGPVLNDFEITATPANCAVEILGLRSVML